MHTGSGSVNEVRKFDREDETDARRLKLRLYTENYLIKHPHFLHIGSGGVSEGRNLRRKIKPIPVEVNWGHKR